MNLRIVFSFFFVFFCTAFIAYSQPVYTMSNNAVVGCEGILLDSGNGATAGFYDHNENYAFTICLPGNGNVIFTLSAMCLEPPYDYLMIYDGNSTAAPLLMGPITGSTPPTGNIISSGNCLTVQFISDANVACTGFTALWTSEIDEPIIPSMTLTNLNPTCNTSNVIVNFSSPIQCDSLITSNFSINGPSGSTVVSATPLNCVNGFATSAQLQLSPGLNESGYYYVGYGTAFLDECGNLWNLQATDTLAVTDCPLSVTMESTQDTICSGSCTEIDSDPEGGNFLNYNYVWNPSLPNGDGPFQVCPTTTTTYTVTITDGSNAPPAIGSITIVVLPPPTFANFPPICQSAPPINLNANPPGGTWSGEGIIDSLLGTFDPSVTGAGTFDIEYTSLNGCQASTSITVLPADAGPDEAACPGTAPFLVSGQSPTGGVWSGPNITPAGLFNPASAGNYTITYTVNGCTDTKVIRVQNIVLTPIDTLCESADSLVFTFSPIGGSWSGAGIVNTYWGGFDAGVAGDGLHTLTYTIQGCSTSFDIFIKDINVNWGFTACPSEPPFLITPAPTPAGGTWTLGQGIVNTQTGLYNPALVSSGNWFADSLVYTVNGCSDYMFAYVVQTAIYTDTVSFCPDDVPLLLNWDNVKNTPWDGIWTGAGITDPDYPGTFDPIVAGPGTHILHYEANTCADSMVMIVREYAVKDTNVCEKSLAFTIPTPYPGGIWSGTGVTDTLTGIFDPQISGIGVFPVTYVSPDSCITTANITVAPIPLPVIQGLAPNYCYKQQSAQLSANPPGGIFSGAGVVGNTFYPLQAGIGQHIITYTYGVAPCQKSSIAVTNVSPPLTVHITTNDSILCGGEYTTLTAQAAAGGSAAYTYTWSNGLGQGAAHAINPTQTTTYYVTANDGCSTPAIDSITVGVSGGFSLQFQTGDKVCFGEAGIAVVRAIGNGNFTYSWHTNPPQWNDTLIAPGFYDYDVTVTETNSGCQQMGNVVIPAYPYVNADFLPNPTGSCMSILSPICAVIDMSAGAVSGQWNMGDGTTLPYVPGGNLTHTYADTGKFVIRLVVENEMGCKDSAMAKVCVTPEETYVHIPDAFTPNNDNVNDVYQIVGNGFQSFYFAIYDRWGTKVFESENPNFQWNGKYKNQDVPEGVYVYVLKALQISNNSLINYRPLVIEKSGTITVYR